ncbi:MAG: hypothetical protein AAFN42_22625 [Cyanobacteria bacterium J06554_1]
MNAITVIVIQLSWTLLGAALGVAFPAILTWWRYKRRPELLGTWQSRYQGIDEPKGTWVEEEIHIDVSLGKFRLKNAKSNHKYNYRANGFVVQKVYLVGEWESMRPGANAYGSFILTISAQGDCMYGYWVGPDKSGARRYGRWVLARREENIEKAKRLMESMRTPCDT